MLTGNQRLALRLAELVINQQLQPGDLTDDQWQLLVLAAGVTHQKVPQVTVCERVIDNYLNRCGYFTAREYSFEKERVDATLPATRGRGGFGGDSSRGLLH